MTSESWTDFVDVPEYPGKALYLKALRDPGCITDDERCLIIYNISAQERDAISINHCQLTWSELVAKGSAVFGVSAAEPKRSEIPTDLSTDGLSESEFKLLVHTPGSINETEAEKRARLQEIHLLRRDQRELHSAASRVVVDPLDWAVRTRAKRINTAREKARRKELGPLAQDDSEWRPKFSHISLWYEFIETGPWPEKIRGKGYSTWGMDVLRLDYGNDEIWHDFQTLLDNGVKNLFYYMYPEWADVADKFRFRYLEDKEQLEARSSPEELISYRKARNDGDIAAEGFDRTAFLAVDTEVFSFFFATSSPLFLTILAYEGRELDPGDDNMKMKTVTLVSWVALFGSLIPNMVRKIDKQPVGIVGLLID